MIKRISLFLTLLLQLSACSSLYEEPIATPPQLATRTKSGELLASLPPARSKVVVAVYDFQDQTGQMKQVDTFADYSHAVTQGGLSILTKALLDTSHKKWFTVIERGDLKNLLAERQIIKVTRGEYQNPDKPLSNIKPMLYAGIIIEGGIVSYESNIITGGAGAKYLGVGGSAQYRRDIVTVYLRAVSSQTGEILLSVNTSKTIYSTAISASAFRFVSLDKLLELESGVTFNEPPQFAVRQAIEMGVYALIMEGALDQLWDFKDTTAGKAAIMDYLRKRDGEDAVKEITPTPVAEKQQLSGNFATNAVLSPSVASEPTVKEKNIPNKTPEKADSMPVTRKTEKTSEEALPFYDYGRSSLTMDSKTAARDSVMESSRSSSAAPVEDNKPASNSSKNSVLILKHPKANEEKALPEARYSGQNYNWIKSSQENCEVNGGCDAGTNP